MNYRIISTTIISLAIIVCASLLGKAWLKTHNNLNTIKVTGLSQKDFNSDLIVWKGSFTQRAYSLKDAYKQVKQDIETVKKYFSKKGINSKEVVFASVNIDKIFKNIYNSDGALIKQEFDGYSLTQNVQIESKEVDKIEQISREITEIIDEGVEFTSFQPEYFYTKLAELKLEMLSNATKDGYVRAANIADNAQNSIGDLKSANMGIFQITAQNSGEDYSWGGTFNTSSKRKTASITVKLEFEIK